MKPFNLRLLFIPLLLLFTFKGISQASFRLGKAEQEMKELFGSIGLGSTDSARLSLSRDFQKQLRLALNLPGSETYPWDSLKNLAKLESPDGLFRLYNWNVPSVRGGNKYFCIIQFKGALKKLKPVALTDHSDSIHDPSTYAADSMNWYGALYYKIIPFNITRKQIAYILLGWEGLNNEVNNKLIEVMTTGDGKPEFGKAVFTGYKDGKQLRIIFNYASSASMSLKYSLQTIPGKPQWNERKREFESKRKQVSMIVFDHLLPLDPQLEGQYKFYVPSSETAEGFIYENFSWKYVPEFDALNP